MPDDRDVKKSDEAVLAVPGLLYVGPERAGRSEVSAGPAAGWMAPRGIAQWERELSFVPRAGLTPALASALRATLPGDQIAAKRYPMARRAVDTSPFLALSGNLVHDAKAQGARIHTVGVDRVSGDFFYFEEGGPGEGVREQGNLVEMLGPSLEASTTNAEIAGLLNDLIDRLLLAFSKGVVSELAVELADALPRLSRDGTGLAGTDLDAFEAKAQAFATASSRWEAAAASMPAALAAAEHKGERSTRVPLFGEARRDARPALALRVGGKPFALPERPLWTVVGPPREESRPAVAPGAAQAVPVAAQAVPVPVAAPAVPAPVAAPAAPAPVAAPAVPVPVAAKPAVARPAPSPAPARATASPAPAPVKPRVSPLPAKPTASPSAPRVAANPIQSPSAPRVSPQPTAGVKPTPLRSSPIPPRPEVRDPGAPIPPAPAVPAMALERAPEAAAAPAPAPAAMVPDRIVPIAPVAVVAAPAPAAVAPTPAPVQPPAPSRTPAPPEAPAPPRASAPELAPAASRTAVTVPPRESRKQKKAKNKKKKGGRGASVAPAPRASSTVPASVSARSSVPEPASSRTANTTPPTRLVAAAAAAPEKKSSMTTIVIVVALLVLAAIAAMKLLH
jgi:hypothetical protein